MLFLFIGYASLLFQMNYNGFKTENLVCDHTTITLLGQPEIDNFSIRFDGCETIDILIIEGHDITNLEGLSSLKKVKNNLSIKSTSLVDFEGLNHIDLSSLEYLIINNNSKLLNLDGLNCCKELKYLTVRTNASLREIDNLKEITEVGYFYLSSNDSLLSLIGLQKLKSVDRFTIYNNGRLQNIDGLESLERVNTMSLFENHNLFNINALRNLREYNSVYIYQNCSLRNCCGVMNVIGNKHDDNHLSISYNSVDCRSIDDIIQSCTSNLVPAPIQASPIFVSNSVINGISTDLLVGLKVYPNPFDDYLAIECEVSDNEIGYVLYDASGRPLLLGRLTSDIEQISTTTFHAGSYFLRVRSGKSLKTFKLVKN